MIPKSIKIDNNGDFYISDFHDDEISHFTFEEIEESYLLAKSKKYPETVKYGCYVDGDKAKVYDDCEIDFCANDLGCSYAIDLQKQGKGKTDCQYWRPIEIKK